MPDTPKTWPEGAQPTAQQAADWLTVCTDEERLRFAEWALRAGETASDCFVRGHDLAVDELLSLRQKFAGAYDKGREDVLAELRELLPDWATEPDPAARAELATLSPATRPEATDG